MNVATNKNMKFGAVLHSMASVLITYFYVNITLHIHKLWILSPFLYDIYYQQYYEDLKRVCVCDCCIKQCSVNIDDGMYFVFAGIEASPQGNIAAVGITLRVFLYIENNVLLYYYYNHYYYYYYY